MLEIFFLFLYLLILIFYIGAMYKGLASFTWVKSTGVVLSSKVVAKKSWSSNNIYYVPEIIFEYTVNGKVYNADSYRFLGYRTQIEEKCEMFIELFTKGKSVNIYYNPVRHKEAVLMRGISSISILLFVIFLLFGLTFI